jgi:hypothetical protein
MVISYIRYTGALTLENLKKNQNSLSDSAEFAGTILMLKLFENRVINTMNKLAASVEDIKATRSPSPRISSHVGAASQVSQVGAARSVGPKFEKSNYQVRAIDRAGAVSGGSLRTPVSQLRALPPVSSLRTEAQAGAQAGEETDSCVLASIKVYLSLSLSLFLSLALLLASSITRALSLALVCALSHAHAHAHEQIKAHKKKH